MTCRAARRQLPLFVGRDLRAPDAGAVSGHVAACALCRAELEALAAARDLLPLASPSFDESDRSLLHRRILDEIARRRESPSPFAAFFGRPRFAFASLAGALVIAASLVSPFLVRNAGELPDARPRPPLASAPPAALGESAATGAAGHPDRQAAVASARHAGGKARAPVAPAPVKPASAMRLEIQTPNVNVRVIWFVGKASEPEPSPGSARDPNVS